MEISARYQMTPKEVRSGTLAISRMRLVVFYGIVLVTPAAIDTNGFQRLRLSDAVIFPAIEAFIIYLLLRNQRRQAARLAVPSTLTLTDETVTLALPTSAVTHQWTTFVRLASVKHFWLFYTTKQCAMIIPKRAFDAAQQEQIEAFVRSSVAGTAVQPQWG